MILVGAWLGELSTKAAMMTLAGKWWNLTT